MVKICVISMLLLAGVPAWASSVHIVVAEKKTADCPPPPNAEETRYVLKPKEAATALKRYVEEKKNPKLYDAAFTNAGLRFCGEKEARVVFDALASTLGPDVPPERAMDLVRQYARNATLLEAIEEKLKDQSISTSFRRNLLDARGMTIPPKKPKPSPSPGP